MSLVLACSVTLAWYFEDELTEATRAVLHQVAESGATVPLLWRFEVANGLQMALRRGRIDAKFRDETLSDLAEFDITTDTDGDMHAWSSTVRLAERHRLTVYDAAYLELAQRRRLPLATLDKALIEACRAELVPAVGT